MTAYIINQLLLYMNCIRRSSGAFAEIAASGFTRVQPDKMGGGDLKLTFRKA
jgi:hypothetical protein